MSTRLVIVIPYYKRRFFRRTLDSLVGQTCRDFEVFVGDDASPEDPRGLIDEVKGRLSITYHRFPDNLGHLSLSRHWNRCVEMTRADWVWVFSDDDIAEPYCVEFFLRELAGIEQFDLYRFEKGEIDDSDRESARLVEVPAVESAEELILSRFMQSRVTTIPEHIFSRAAFNREGGFVDFPFAWCADDATWAAFARITGVKTVRGVRVLWRNGQFNLSAPNQFISSKVQALELYLKWLQRQFPRPEFQSKLARASRLWFPNAFSWLGDFVPLGSLLHFWLAFRRFSGQAEWSLLLCMLRRNSSASRYLRKVRRLTVATAAKWWGSAN